MISNPGRPVWILTVVIAFLGICACATSAVLAWVMYPEEAKGERRAEAGVEIPMSPEVEEPVTEPLTPSLDLDLSPRRVTATVVEVEGSSPIARGATCAFDIEIIDRQNGLLCHTEAVCGGYLLYGSAQNGYFPCTVEEPPGRGIDGRDVNSTAVDSDPRFEINGQNETIRIADDPTGIYGSFRVVARVDSIR